MNMSIWDIHENMIFQSVNFMYCAMDGYTIGSIHCNLILLVTSVRHDDDHLKTNQFESYYYLIVNKQNRNVRL